MQLALPYSMQLLRFPVQVQFRSLFRHTPCTKSDSKIPLTLCRDYFKFHSRLSRVRKQFEMHRDSLKFQRKITKWGDEALLATLNLWKILHAQYLPYQSESGATVVFSLSDINGSIAVAEQNTVGKLARGRVTRHDERESARRELSPISGRQNCEGSF